MKRREFITLLGGGHTATRQQQVVDRSRLRAGLCPPHAGPARPHASKM
jgi:hypothetical protein